MYHGDGKIDTFNSRKLTENKVTELFCIADDFCKFFDAMMEKDTKKSEGQVCFYSRTTRKGENYHKKTYF